MKRKILLLAILVTGTMYFTGCNKKGETTPQDPITSSNISGYEQTYSVRVVNRTNLKVAGAMPDSLNQSVFLFGTREKKFWFTKFNINTKVQMFEFVNILDDPDTLVFSTGKKVFGRQNLYKVFENDTSFFLVRVLMGSDFTMPYMFQYVNVNKLSGRINKLFQEPISDKEAECCQWYGNAFLKTINLSYVGLSYKLDTLFYIKNTFNNSAFNFRVHKVVFNVDLNNFIDASFDSGGALTLRSCNIIKNFTDKYVTWSTTIPQTAYAQLATDKLLNTTYTIAGTILTATFHLQHTTGSEYTATKSLNITTGVVTN